MRIDTIGTQGVEPFVKLPEGGPKAESGGKSFGQFLSDAVGNANSLQQHADDLVKRFATGERLDVHQVMIAIQEASTALSLTMQVRNKLVDAYQEIMKTSV